MQVYTEPSLNNRIREKAIRNESLDRNTEKNVKRSADVSGSGRRFCLFEFNYAGCEQSRSEMERWTRTTQRTRNESCVRLGKRTPFLRLRAQLPRMADSQ